MIKPSSLHNSFILNLSVISRPGIICGSGEHRSQETTVAIEEILHSEEKINKWKKRIRRKEERKGKERKEEKKRKGREKKTTRIRKVRGEEYRQDRRKREEGQVNTQWKEVEC